MADDEARIVSVVGGAKRTSRWRIAEDTSVLTLFGRCLLDLREAETEADELWFSVASVFAKVEIIVPEGTIVQPSGMAFLGASSCEVPTSRRVGPLPPIEIDNVTVFGSLRIHVGQRPPRVGLLRRLLRRGPKEEPAPIAPADTMSDVEQVETSDVERDGPSLVDELRMDDGTSEPDAPAEDDRTDMNELDDVLADVLGDDRDLLSGGESDRADARPAPDGADPPTAQAEADDSTATDGATEATTNA